MSFHRVLPLLPALSNEALRDRWATKPDALRSSKIMPENKDSTEEASSRDHGLVKAAAKSSSPPEDQGPSSTGEEELEPYDLPKHPGRSLSQTPDARSRPFKTVEKSSSDEALDRWRGESPSSICLCQPDPKVPRPRNGKYLRIKQASRRHPSLIQFTFSQAIYYYFTVLHD